MLLLHVFYDNEVLYRLLDSMYYDNIISERIGRTGNTELFQSYGFIYPMFIKNILGHHIEESEALCNIFLGKNHLLAEFMFSKNIIHLTELLKYFTEPNNYQTINYFYECKSFDISLLQFSLTFILISLFF